MSAAPGTSRRITRRGVDEWQTEIAAYLPGGWTAEPCQRTSDQLDAVRLWCGSREAATLTVDELAALPHLGTWVASVVGG